MYKIESKEYGFKLTFSDSVTIQELESWIEQSEKLFPTKSKQFGVFVDLRNIMPISAPLLAHFREGQQLYKENGMIRSVVILRGALITLQFRDIAKQSNIFKEERYIDASSNPNWEAEGLEWIKKGKEPSVI